MSDQLEQAEKSSWLSDAFYEVAVKANDLVPGLGPALYQIGHIPQSFAEATVVIGCTLGLGK